MEIAVDQHLDFDSFRSIVCCIFSVSVHYIRDERLDLLENLQEHRQELLDVLISLITTTGIREEDLQAVLTDAILRPQRCYPFYDK